MPPHPLRAFFIVNILQKRPEKNTLENVASLGASSLKQYLKCVGLFAPFLGVTSLYLVNTQPNSKFHPPPKFSGSTPECKIEDFFKTSPLKFYKCAPSCRVPVLLSVF